MDDGYNIIRSEAPNDLGGRLCRNLALTTPELPIDDQLISFLSFSGLKFAMLNRHTMCPCNFAPHHPNLRTSDLSMCAVDESHFLAQVKSAYSIND